MRELTQAQHKRLDAIDRTDPDARVVAWGGWGPLVRFTDGRLREVTPKGRCRESAATKRFGL